jgi:hypothetical protein
MGACELTAVDPYFRCPGLGPSCAAHDAGASGSAGSGVDAGDVSSAGSAGSAGCKSSAECGSGTCFRGECGPSFELVYLDTPSEPDPENAQWIKFQVQIKNRTTVGVPLDTLMLRYFYTPEGVDSELQVLSVSTLPVKESYVVGRFGVTELDAGPQWTVLTVGFVDAAGFLEAGQSTGPIKVGIHDRDFGPGRFFQPNDWSYLNGSHLALYWNGDLVSGTPPDAPPAE